MGMGNFARGFVPSFNDAYERNQRRQDDMFNKMYEEFKSKREQAAEYKREDSRLVKKAQMVATDLGLPEGAWVQAYERLKSGYTIDKTMEELRNYRITPSELPAGQVNPANAQTDQMLERSSTSNAPVTDLAPIDLLTQDKSPEGKAKAIMESPLTQEVPQTQPQGVMGRITQGLDGYRSLVNRRNTNAVMERLAAVTGASPEELQQMFNANPNLSRPISELIQEGQTTAPRTAQNTQVAQAPYTMERIDQSGVLNREELLKREIQLIDDVSKDLNTYATQKRLAKSVVRDVKDMYTLIDPATGSAVVQNEFASKIAQFFEGARNTMSSLADLAVGDPKFFGDYVNIRNIVVENKTLDPTIMENNMNALQSGINSAQQYIEELTNGPVGQRMEATARARTIYDMRMQVVAYKLAMLYQQEGRSLAETERIMFQEMASGGNTPEKFLEKLGLLITGEVARLEDTRNGMAGDLRVKHYEALSNGVPLRGFHEALGGPISEEFSNDPEIGEFYQVLEKSAKRDFSATSLSKQNGQPQQAQTQPQVLYTEVPPESIELIRSNPNDPTLKRYFIATYGEEAYRKYTNGK